MKFIKLIVILYAPFCYPFMGTKHATIKGTSELTIDLSACKNNIGCLKSEIAGIETQYRNLIPKMLNSIDPEAKQELKDNLQELMQKTKNLHHANNEILQKIQLQDIYGIKRPQSIKDMYNAILKDVNSNATTIELLMKTISNKSNL